MDELGQSNGVVVRSNWEKKDIKLLDWWWDEKNKPYNLTKSVKFNKNSKNYPNKKHDINSVHKINKTGPTLQRLHRGSFSVDVSSHKQVVGCLAMMKTSTEVLLFFLKIIFQISPQTLVSFPPNSPGPCFPKSSFFNCPGVPIQILLARTCWLR